MDGYARGGVIRGAGDVPAMLHGCRVHARPHPRRLIRDLDGTIQCDGEWVIAPSAARGMVTDVLGGLNG